MKMKKLYIYVSETLPLYSCVGLINLLLIIMRDNGRIRQQIMEAFKDIKIGKAPGS